MDEHDHAGQLLLTNSQEDGWEILFSAEEQRKRFTAEQVARNQERYQAAVDMLGQNMPFRQIARLLHMSTNTLSVIAQREAKSVEAAKEKLGRVMMAASGYAVQAFTEQLFAGKVTARDASIAAGIFADKGLVLAGQPSAIVENRHAVAVVDPGQVNGFWKRVQAAPSDSGSDGAGAQVVDVATVPSAAAGAVTGLVTGQVAGLEAPAGAAGLESAPNATPEPSGDQARMGGGGGADFQAPRNDARV